MSLAAIDANPVFLGPSRRELMQRALEPYILLGMPHLTPLGLSETWVMKEVGHRHWLMLAIELGMNDADFRTRDGHTVYASICATSLRNSRLDLAGANDIVEFRSSLTPLSRTRFATTHRLFTHNGMICEIELVSVFVKRNSEADNHSLVRIDLAPRIGGTIKRSSLAEEATAIRRNAATRHLGLSLDGENRLLSVTSPDPREDFNGAGLLYFALFQSLFAKAMKPILPTGTDRLRKDVFFFGNVQPKENVTVTLEDILHDNRGYSCKMAREDGKIIARLVAIS